MEKLKVLVNVDQKLAILAGKTEYGMGLVAVNPANLTEEQRQVLVGSATRHYQGQPYIYPQQESAATSISTGTDVPLTEATETAVIATLDSRIERRRQELEKEKEAFENAVTKYLSTVPEQLYSARSRIVVDGIPFQSTTPETDEWVIDTSKQHFGFNWRSISFSDDERAQAHQAKVAAICATHNAAAAEKVREIRRTCEVRVQGLAEQILQNGPTGILSYKRSDVIGKRWYLPRSFNGESWSTWKDCNHTEVIDIINEAKAQLSILNTKEVGAYGEQLNAWIAAKGTDNQKKRYALGLLPDEEILDSICSEAFKVLEPFPRYEYLEDLDKICCTCEYETCNVDVWDETSTDLTAEQFEIFDAIVKEIQSVHPTASVVAWDNVRESEDCENTLVTKYAEVSLDIGVLHLIREYRLS